MFSKIDSPNNSTENQVSISVENIYSPDLKTPFMLRATVSCRDLLVIHLNFRFHLCLSQLQSSFRLLRY